MVHQGKGIWIIAMLLAIGTGISLYILYQQVTLIKRITIAHDDRLSDQGRHFFQEYISAQQSTKKAPRDWQSHEAWVDHRHQIVKPSIAASSYCVAAPCAWLNEDVVLGNGMRLPGAFFRQSCTQDLPRIQSDRTLDIHERTLVPAIAALVEDLCLQINIQRPLVVWRHPHHIRIDDQDTGCSFICHAHTRLSPAQYHELSRLVRCITPATYDLRCQHHWTITDRSSGKKIKGRKDNLV